MTTDLDRPPTARSAPPSGVGPASARLVRVTLGLLLIATGIAGGLFLLGDRFSQVERATTSHPEVDRVVFDLNANGDVEVVVGDADQVVVEQRVETSIRDLDVSLSVSDGDLLIHSASCGWSFAPLPDRCSASFVVTVPAATVLTGRAGHGSIALVGVEGDVTLTTGHGSITASDTGGLLDLRTGHGSVTVSGAQGDAVLDSGHGSITVRGGGRASLEARTGHGSIVAEDGGHEVAALRTGHGSVRFEPSGAPADATVTTSHGDVVVLLPRDSPPYAVSTDASGRRVDVGVATDPAAEHDLEVVTGHGTIEIGYRTP